MSKDPSHLYSILQEGKQVVFVRLYKKQMFRMFQSAHSNEVYLVSIISGDIPALNSYRYDDVGQKRQVERLLSCASYTIFETEKEAMQFMVLKRYEMNKEE